MEQICWYWGASWQLKHQNAPTRHRDSTDLPNPVNHVAIQLQWVTITFLFPHSAGVMVKRLAQPSPPSSKVCSFSSAGEGDKSPRGLETIIRLPLLILITQVLISEVPGVWIKMRQRLIYPEEHPHSKVKTTIRKESPDQGLQTVDRQCPFS